MGRALAVAAATLAGNAFLLLCTLPFAFVCLLVAFIPPRGDWTFRGARLWARCLLTASGVRVRARFAVPPPPRAVYMPNHQSLYDIPALLVVLPGQTRLLAKRSLFQIPLFGWAMRAGGFVPVDRRRRQQGRDAFAAAVSRLRQGASVLLFPEATRSRDGQLQTFERGGVVLAKRCGLPIVPVGVRGTFAVQRRGSWAIRPGEVEIHFGEAMAVEEVGEGNGRTAIAEVRRRVAALAGLPESTVGDAASDR